MHAFATVARETGIDRNLTAPFFASMRRDLSPVAFESEELRTYIYGSAEVVGLMCLRVFLRGEAITETDRARLEEGARRLGAAFQKINFLRDLGTDWLVLGRSYFPGIDPGALTENEKRRLLDDIDADLDAAASAIPHLPRNCRRAVTAAHSRVPRARRRALAHARRRAASTAGCGCRTPHKAVIIAAACLGRGVARG